MFARGFWDKTDFQRETGSSTLRGIMQSGPLCHHGFWVPVAPGFVCSAHQKMEMALSRGLLLSKTKMRSYTLLTHHRCVLYLVGKNALKRHYHSIFIASDSPWRAKETHGASLNTRGMIPTEVYWGNSPLQQTTGKMPVGRGKACLPPLRKLQIGGQDITTMQDTKNCREAIN